MGRISAKAYKYDGGLWEKTQKTYYKSGKEQENIDAVRGAFAKAKKELGLLCESVSESEETQRQICTAHLAIVEDEGLLERILRKVEREGLAADAAITEVFDAYIEHFQKSEDVVFADKVLDLLDVKRRLLCSKTQQVQFTEEVILVAKELLPSELLQMDTRLVKGIITEKGSALSHVAILARVRQIPIITGREGIWDAVEDGATLELDFGQMGQVSDGFCRTEIGYMMRTKLPTEEELLAEYRQELRCADGAEVIFRTADFGGDKTLAYVPALEYMPAKAYVPEDAGLRGIQWSFAHADIFHTQLRALLRASAYAPMKLMFPMVESMEDIRRAKSLVCKVMAELEMENITYNKTLPIGVMIETATIAKMVEQVVEEVDFACVGTNDLMASISGRSRQELDVLSPVLEQRLIEVVAPVLDCFYREGKEIHICGELAEILHKKFDGR